MDIKKPPAGYASFHPRQIDRVSRPVEGLPTKNGARAGTQERLQL